MHLKNVTIRRKDSYILDNARLDLLPGGVTLILGESGVGKSTMLLGLAGVGERAGIEASGIPTAAGLVFQGAALYDDLTVAQNLALVADYGPTPEGPRLDQMASLLDGINLSALPNALSHGQKQRVAIARCLCADHPLLLMDEPNAGLDPVRAEALAEAVAAVAASGRHVLIAAHHPEIFLPIVTQVLFLNGKGDIIALPPEADAIRAAYGCSQHEPKDRAQVDLQGLDVHRAWFHWPAVFLGQALWSVVLAPSNILFVCLACALVGFTLAYVSISSFPFSGLLLDLSVEELLRGLGDATYRFSVPVLVSILIAARSGALMTSEMAQKHLEGQMLSLAVLRVPIAWLRALSLVLIMAVGMMALTGAAMIATLLATIGAILIGADLDARFVHSRILAEVNGFPNWQWVALKTALSGALIGLVCVWVSSRPLASGREITDAASNAILLSVLGVITLHAGIVLWEMTP